MSFLKPLAVMALAALTAAPASAATLITVDVTDPSAVTFTGTEAAPDAASRASVGSGFTLLDLFTSSLRSRGSINDNLSNLYANGSSFQLRDVFFPNGAGRDDMNIYNTPSGGTSINLTLGEYAFRGVLTVDLSAHQDLLPTAGTTGNIILGDNPRNRFRPVVGQWSVAGPAPVPLPASGLLLMGAVASLAVRRKR